MSALTKAKDFRDKLATADEQGKRLWLYPRRPEGRMYQLRTVLSWFQLAFLLGAPFIKVNGYPLIMFNILELKFSLFGLVFWPHDFHIFVLAMLTLVVAIILLTSIVGRVWCGWMCPQTVFMEMLFRKIEYAIEGSHSMHRRRDKAAPSWDRRRRKLLKHSIFLALSFVLGNVFLGYIIGGDALIELIADPPQMHVAGLTAMVLFSLAFYWLYASFREQFCTFLCPYARLQSVLLDDDSIAVIYDGPRGEPRGKKSKRPDPNVPPPGDCVDCGICVQVCPTGIDIRDGAPQLECINCAACIDGCDAVMRKLDRPTGLIRYASNRMIQERRRFQLRPRAVVYIVILGLLTSATCVLLLNRQAIEATALRTPGVMPLALADGAVRNLYNLRIVNKRQEAQQLGIKLVDQPGQVAVVGGSFALASETVAQATILVDIPASALVPGRSDITLDVLGADGQLLARVRTTFDNPQ
jgi:cytochrome c oxidase accessory protein FixG